MGCQCSISSSSNELEEEETLMSLCESSLGFTPHEAAKVWTSIRILTLNETLNWNRMRKLAQDWRLEMPEPEEQEDPVAQFYRGMRKGEGWEARRLGMLGLMLGKGGRQEKVELLFGMYDWEYNKALGRTEVELMVTDLCDLALKQLPTLAIGTLEAQGNLDGAVLLQNYSAKLHEACLPTTQAVLSQLFPTSTQSISLVAFKDKVAQDRLDFLVSASDLRKEAWKRYKARLRDEAKHKGRSATQTREESM